MTIAQRRAAALAEAQAANARAVNGVLAAADQTAFDTAMAAVAACDAEQVAAEAAQVAAAERSSRLQAANVPAPRRSVLDGPVQAPAAARIPAEPRAAADGTAGFRSPREFLSQVMRAGQGRAGLDPRLAPLAVAGSDEASGFSDAYGGFLIPPSYMPNLLQVQQENDPTAGRTTAIPMNAPIVRVNARTDKNHQTSVTGGLRFFRRMEGDAATASRMQLEQIELRANPLTGLSFATEELLVDSPQSFLAILEQAFGQEYAATMLTEKLFGTGVGQYMGVMNSPCLVTVAKEAGQAAATIVYQNILKMRAACWRYGDAVWIANHMCFPQLAQLSLAVGTGGSAVYMPSAQLDRPDMLLGRPIFYSEFAQVLGTPGDLILGNWSQFLEGTYQTPTQADSMHVRFVNNEHAFRITARNDGQPWWRTPLTPRQGNPLSPFVALAQR